MAELTIAQAVDRIIKITSEVSLYTRDWPKTLPPEQLQKHVGQLTLAINRLAVCVRNLAEGRKTAGPSF
jgi:hypothetical protein